MDEADISGWIWYSIMVAVSVFNICILYIVMRQIPTNNGDVDSKIIKERKVLRVCAVIFTIVCAYRAILPRIDVPRICWYDIFLNWIIFGRLAATIAEVSWAT